jgi:hypothetical protein
MCGTNAKPRPAQATPLVVNDFMAMAYQSLVAL